jgi:hypothetical protein
MTLVKAFRDVLGEILNLALFRLFGILVVEAWQDMLLVQALQSLAASRNVCKQLGDFVRDVGPAGRQEIHLDHGVAIILECARGQEAARVI